MFQQMMTKVDGDGPFGGSGSLKIWRSFMTDQFAKSFAKAGGIGLAPKIYRGLLKHQGLSAMTPITTPGRSRKAIGDLAALIEKLSGLIEQETALVRAGQLRNASAIEPAKARTRRPASSSPASG